MTLLAPQQAYMLLGLFYVAATKQEQPLFLKISKEYLVITKTKQNLFSPFFTVSPVDFTSTTL